MKLWTIQDSSILDDIEQKGFAHCNQKSSFCTLFPHAYNWLAEEMRKQVGLPPFEEIEYPLWAWYQYTSYKKPKPPKSPRLLDSDQQEGVFLEIDIPDKDVLLSDFDLWHWVLNGCSMVRNKQLDRMIEQYVRDTNGQYDFNTYPEEIKKEIISTWCRVFDFSTRDKHFMAFHKHNRCIQATFWVLKEENIIDISYIRK